MVSHFEVIYQEKLFGVFCKQHSGPGSTVVYATHAIDFLKNKCNELHIESIADLSCGDMAWQAVLLEQLPNIQFFGIDVSSTVIARNQQKYRDKPWTFICASSTSTELPIPKCDLVICRHTMMHLPIPQALKMLNSVQKYGKYAVLTSHRRKCNPTTDTPRVCIPLPHNVDTIDTALQWVPLNMELPPFNCEKIDEVLENRCKREWLILIRT